MSSPQLKSTKNYEISRIIDSGNFGTVYTITVHEDKKVYAVKQINIEKFDEKERPAALADAIMEYNLLKKGIPNVLRSFGSFYDANAEVFKFSTECMEMNLAQFIKSKGSLSFIDFIPIFSDIVSGKI